MRVLQCSPALQQLEDANPVSKWRLRQKQPQLKAVRAQDGGVYTLAARKHGSMIRQAIGGLLMKRRKKNRERKGLEEHAVDPLSPGAPSTAQLSRTNSDSTQDGVEDILGHVGSSRRVTFKTAVKEVLIDQMDEKELGNTFYTRRELSVFREAYRFHRSTPDWKRENDGLPCDCDACQDRVDWESQNNMESPPVSPPVGQPLAREESVQDYSFRDGVTIPHFDEDIHCEGHPVDSHSNGPPSPVISLRGGARAHDEMDVDVDADAEEPVADYQFMASPDPFRGCEGGSSRTCVSPTVQHAVAQFGEHYAYMTLRMQGFSDWYIRTHFMPQGCLEEP